MAAERTNYVREYHPPQVAHTLSESPSRFGHTSDVSNLFGGAGKNSSDYTTGLAIAAGLTGLCFLVAMVAIVILMLCGRKRVGFLSGAPFHKSVELVESDETSLNSDFFPIKSPSPALSTNTNDGCCGVHQSTWVRATFILSGAIIILFAILLVTQGLTNLQSTVTTFHQSSVDIGSLAAQAENIINTRLISIRGLASSTRNSLSQEINGSNFCPADPNLNNNQVAHDIRAQANEAVSVLGKLDSILQAPVDNVYNALRQVAKGAQQVQSGTENVDFIGWEALVILIPGTIVPCILVAAAILAQFDVEFPMFTCVINWFVMPLFIIMVIFYAAVASLMIAGAAINSDFCLPGGRPEDSYPGTSPDTTVYRVLDAYGYTTPAQFVRQIANYYVAQCQNVEDPYAFMTDYLPNLTASQQQLAAFKATVDVNGTLAALSTYCNRDFGTIDATVTQMETIVNSLLTAVNQTLDLVACQRIVPIYDQAMYDGACEYSVMAVFWVFSSALIMGTFGLLMILFRAAYKPTISDHVSLHEIVNKVDVDDSEELFERVNLDDDVVSEESPRHLDNSGHHY